MKHICEQIIDLTLTQLTERFPALSPAFYLLSFREISSSGMGTDGTFFYYSEKELCSAFLQGKLTYLFLHSLCHCLFLHMFSAEDKDISLWNLSSDMAVCCFLDTWFFPDNPESIQRKSVYRSFFSDVSSASAEKFYVILKDRSDIPDLKNLFAMDFHGFWKNSKLQQGGGFEGDGGASPDISRLSNIQAALELIVRNQLLLPRRKQPAFGQTPGSKLELILLRKKGSYDFRRYLRRFSITLEEPKINMESFDYIPYCYGLKKYGNLPFLEPLEYGDSSKVQDLVIAIDTSGSCSEQVVSRFLSETLSILSERKSFFRKMNVHLIQCDSAIQAHTVIHSPEEWAAFSKGFRILGRGGTDFTPVFSYVETLQQNGELKNLKGLFYFTDGNGIYPTKPTPYETAFVFTDFSFFNYKIPGFITKLCLDMNQAGNEVFAYEH